jgi:hypothetical protein
MTLEIERESTRSHSLAWGLPSTAQYYMKEETMKGMRDEEEDVSS